MENPILIDDNDIQIMINRHKLDQHAASISPKYKKYLNMEKELESIENQINNSKNILQQNELKKQYDVLQISILDFLNNWTEGL